MSFTLQITELGNAAFGETDAERRNEIARQLEIAAKYIRAGSLEMPLHDTNGNKVGSFDLSEFEAMEDDAAPEFAYIVCAEGDIDMVCASRQEAVDHMVDLYEQEFTDIKTHVVNWKDQDEAQDTLMYHGKIEVDRHADEEAATRKAFANAKKVAA